MDQKALPVRLLKLLLILFYYHWNSGGGEKGENTRLQKQSAKERHGCWLCFDHFYPDNAVGPSKAHQNLLQEQETLKKTHIHEVNGGSALAPLHEQQAGLVCAREALAFEFIFFNYLAFELAFEKK